MSKVREAFADYFKAERDRCEAALKDITDIVCDHEQSNEAAIDAIMARLERHWGRYGEPGSLEPLNEVLTALPPMPLVTAKMSENGIG